MPPAAVAALAAMPPPAAVAFSSPNISPVPASDTMWDAMLPAVSPNRLENPASAAALVVLPIVLHIPDLTRLSSAAFDMPPASLEVPASPPSSGLVNRFPLSARVEPASSAPCSSLPMPWVTSGSASSSGVSLIVTSRNPFTVSRIPLFSSLIWMLSAICVSPFLDCIFKFW